MMSEWKELKIDDLPRDILIGDYEFMWDFMDENESFKEVPPEKILSFMRRKTCAILMYRIRQPEPKVTIKRSGGTWVARYDGVDYICTDGRRSGDLKDDFSAGHIERWWSPISTTKITDEIAKLRPIVFIKGDPKTHILYGVYQGIAITDHGHYPLEDGVRLYPI